MWEKNSQILIGILQKLHKYIATFDRERMSRLSLRVTATYDLPHFKRRPTPSTQPKLARLCMAISHPK